MARGGGASAGKAPDQPGGTGEDRGGAEEAVGGRKEGGLVHLIAGHHRAQLFLAGLVLRDPEDLPQ